MREEEWEGGGVGGRVKAVKGMEGVHELCTCTFTLTSHMHMYMYSHNVHRTFTCTCTLYIVSMYMYMACMSLPRRNRRAFMYMCTSHQWCRALCGSHPPPR